MPSWDTKSMCLGCLTGVAAVVLLGANAKEDAPLEWMPVRYLVLEANPSVDAAGKWQSTLLTVCPWYGKIDQASLKRRLQTESQELTIRVMESRGAKPFAQLHRGDIISFDSMKILKAEPGSALVRHLPNGEAELIKP